MKLYTAKQASDVDSFAINKMGIPSIVLMEHAARGAYEELLKRFSPLNELRFIVLYGPGNNGGDALALSRMLILNGAEVILIEAFGKPKTNDCKKELSMLLNANKGLNKLKIAPAKDISKYINELSIVIDGVFGTGFKKGAKADKQIARLFTAVDKAPFVISLDIPSGVDADTGSTVDWAISADLTVTFMLPKVGLYVSPGAVYSGEVVVKDLFAPNAEQNTPYELIDEEYVSAVMLKLQRGKNSNKGNYGHVLVLSPEQGMEGAVSLCALSALKTGAGLVSIAAVNENSKELRKRMPKLSPEIMIKELFINKMNDGELKKYLSAFSAVVVGPGFGKKREKELERIIKNTSRALILDADALNIMAANVEILKLVAKNKNAILTPHPGEMARLSNIEEVQSQRLNILKLFVLEHKVNVVLKGYRSLLASPEGDVLINPTGNPGLAKGGSGDVLSGIIASLCAQGLDTFTAGALGVYTHGLCADRLLEDGASILNITPTDIINELGNTLGCLTKSS